MGWIKQHTTKSPPGTRRACALLCVLSVWLFALSCTDPAPSTQTSPPTQAPQPAASATQAPTQSLRDASFLQTRQVPPACTATLDLSGNLRLGDTKTSLRVPFGPSGSLPELATWTLDDTSVLVAPKPSWTQTPDQRWLGVLWRVFCATGQHEVFVRHEGADFGHAARTRNGRTLYFSGRRGIHALTLATRQATLLSESPKLPAPCQGKLTARDIIQGLTRADTRLTFWRGGPCGHEGAWTWRRHWLVRPGDPTRQSVEQPQQIATVAADGPNLLWMGDAGHCNEPGRIDPQTPGALWLSRDQGRQWTKVPVHDGRSAMNTAAAKIYTAPKSRARLVVYAARCQTQGTVLGGSIFLTDDAGRTWRRLAMPPGRRNRATGQRLFDMHIEDEDLNHIIIWVTPTKRYETRNGGRSWNPLPDAPRVPNNTRFATQGRYLLRATSEGLFRRATTKPGLDRVFPPNPDLLPEPEQDK